MQMSQILIMKNSLDLTEQAILDSQSLNRSLSLPTKIKNLLSRLEEINRNSNENGFIGKEVPSNDRSTSVDFEYSTFCSGFKLLNQKQQKAFIQAMMEQLKSRSEKRIQRNEQVQSDKEYPCYMKEVTCYVQYWNRIVLKLNKNRRKITIVFKNKTIDLHFREYLLRKSRVHNLCFVLENVSLAANRQYNYHIKFLQENGADYKYVESQIKKSIVSSMCEVLLWQISQMQKMRQALQGTRRMKLFLTKQRLSRFAQLRIEREKQKPINEGQLSSEDERYQEISSSDNFKIEKSKNDETLYRATFKLKQNSDAFVLHNFIEAYKTYHKMVIKIDILEQLKERQQLNDSLVYSAIYQKVVCNQKIYGQLLLGGQEVNSSFIQFKNNDSPTLFFTLINIDHQENHSFLEFLQVTAMKLSDSTIEVGLHVKFMVGINFAPKAMQDYLFKFIHVFERQKDVRYSHCGNSLHEEMCSAVKEVNVQRKEQQMIKPNLEQLKIDENKQIEHLFNDNFHEKERSETERVIISYHYLKKRFILTPSKQKRGKILKEHFLWNNWRRAEKGGLICKNQELVQKQKKMFKLVIKKFGQTLLMGKNIINFSLPVIIFKKESHLQSLAKTYLYSPIFTQKAASIPDPLQRMKCSIILMMTENALTIHMQKPFNPLLGETYQGWIDGCPIYLEQISHHPPISSYYFLGRGYKKYGCIQPKISVGLNTASGYSLFPHYVDFDDGMKIEYICAKIVIGGMLIGQRTFNFEDKIYAYDRKHRYFASLRFGQVKNGFFSSSNEPDDYFHGYIYKVTPEFEKYFDQEKGIKPHPQEQHIVQKLTFFDGIWNSFVNVNEKQVLNLKTDLPYEFEEEQMPLASDSRYRDDLSNLLAGDLQAAQAAKQEMEERQRQDRRLRQQYQH